MTLTVPLPAAVARWRAETARLVRVSHARAAAAARKATAEARRLPAGREREAGIALACEARAVAAHASGRYRAAASLYQSAAVRFDGLRLRGEAARVRKNRIDALVYLDRLAEAEREGRSACRAFTRLGDRAGLARTLWHLGNLEQRRDRPARAVALYRRAGRLFAALGDAENQAHMALNEAVALTIVDDFRRALALLDRAREQWRTAGRPLLVAQADFDASWIHALMGEFRRALVLLEKGRAVFVRGRDSVMVATIDLDRGETLLLLNRPGEAETALGLAHAVFRRQKMPIEAGRALTLLAEAAADRGDTGLASRRIVTAIRGLERAGQAGAAARAHLARARIGLARGRLPEARAAGSEAARRFRALGFHSSSAAADVVVAEALLELGRPANARTLLDRLARSTRLPAATTVRVLHLRGRALEAQGRRSAAYRSLLGAIGAIERVRETVPGTAMRSGWLVNKIQVYELAMTLCLAGGRPQDRAMAFLHAEQARARTLADRLAASPVAARTAEGQALLEKYRRIRAEAGWLSGRLARESEPGGRRMGPTIHLARALAKREAALAVLLGRLEATDEETASLVAARGATSEEVAREIDADAVLIEYVVREHETVAFIVGRESLRVVQLPSGAQAIAAAVAELRQQTGRFLFGDAYRQRHHAAMDAGMDHALRRIHALVFAPLAGTLAGRRLVIVPSGPLHEVPFAALLGADGYLIDTHEMVVAPSAAAWRIVRRRGLSGRPMPAGRPLVMGLGEDDLPFAPAECEAIGSVIPGALTLIGPQATLASFRENAPAAPLIHLATHGIFRADDPLLSAVRLTDGPANLHELYDLKLGARLVVLSGCRTGAAAGGAEDRVGLARGFLHAGASALLVSLWEINDSSTSEFMAHFWPLAAGTRRPAAALREAMIAHRERYPNPYYWSPFVLTGDA